MLGMLSVSESEFPALFILVPPGQVHLIPTFKGQVGWQTKVEMKIWDIYFLCIVCQLTGRVMHKPIKLRIPSAEARAFLKNSLGPMKVSFSPLLRLSITFFVYFMSSISAIKYLLDLVIFDLSGSVLLCYTFLFFLTVDWTDCRWYGLSKSVT
jgi:hypothetical protein